MNTQERKTEEERGKTDGWIRGRWTHDPGFHRNRVLDSNWYEPVHAERGYRRGMSRGWPGVHRCWCTQQA